VQVGPFKTQKEADVARRKLKELGLGSGLLIPPQKK
jgi:cell division protein FtsN